LWPGNLDNNVPLSFLISFLFIFVAGDEKRDELVKKYEELKSAGRLEKFMEKRRKKNSNKEHRHMPHSRRNDD